MRAVILWIMWPSFILRRFAFPKRHISHRRVWCFPILLWALPAAPLLALSWRGSLGSGCSLAISIGGVQWCRWYIWLKVLYKLRNGFMDRCMAIFNNNASGRFRECDRERSATVKCRA
ncbi:uncharacterized protein GGS25DRAFT_469744, partial [Hypoxylon fragiforme]|uniref:uncharacterized protein n=1 Tax=Hypoxylon fragiforme TaxID=63214 RepID=UPI0020C67689